MSISYRSFLLLQTVNTYKVLPIGFVNADNSWYQTQELEELEAERFVSLYQKNGIICTDAGAKFLANATVPPTFHEKHLIEQFLPQFEKINKAAKWTITRYQKNEISCLLTAAKIAVITEEFDESLNDPKNSSIANYFNTFIERFANAAKNIRLGEESYIASPLKDSFHSILFEFHQLILEKVNQSRDNRE